MGKSEGDNLGSCTGIANKHKEADNPGTGTDTPDTNT